MVRKTFWYKILKKIWFVLNFYVCLIFLFKPDGKRWFIEVKVRDKYNTLLNLFKVYYVAKKNTKLNLL